MLDRFAWLRHVQASVHGIFHLAPPADAAPPTLGHIPYDWIEHVAPGKPAALYAVDPSSRDAAASEQFGRELPVTPAMVAADQRPIALIIHGVCATTTGTHFALLKQWLTDPAAGRYGLVLGYEYDSIQSGIVSVAADLRARLAALGLLAGQPRLDLYTHSMGGLVARWLLENPGEPGSPAQALIRASVRRLIMAAPPNRGSHMADLGQHVLATLQAEAQHLGAPDAAAAQHMAGHLQLPLVSWIARTLGAAVPRIGHATQGLRDLEPGSSVITALLHSAQALPAHPPYYLIQGIYNPVPDDESVALRLLREAASKVVHLQAAHSDLVVDIASQSGYGPLLHLDPTVRRPDRLIVPGTWHRDYWQKPATFAAIVAGLLERLPE